MNNTYYKVIENQLEKEIEMYGQTIGVTTDVDTYPTNIIKGIVKFKQNLIQSTDYMITIQDKLLFITLNKIVIGDYIFWNNNIYQVTSVDNTIPNIYKAYAKQYSKQKTYILEVEGSENLSLFNGGTYQLVYTCKEDETVVESPIVAFSTSDESVATVSNTGLITVVGNELTSCTITIYWSGQTVSRYINVLENVYNITLNEIGTLEVGATSQLNYTCTCNDLVIENPLVTFISSDESVATVDENGLVTGISKGNVLITATYEDVAATISVSIEENLTPSYTITTNYATIDAEGYYSIQRYNTETFTPHKFIGSVEDINATYTFTFETSASSSYYTVTQYDTYVKVKNNGYSGFEGILHVFENGVEVISAKIKFVR